MINVKNLTFSYGPRKLFDEVSFSVPDNLKVGVVGPNGAGKTTLIKFLAGTQQPDFGEVEIHGSLAWVPQEVKLDPTLDSSPTIRDYLDPGQLKRDLEIRKILDGLEFGYLDLNSPPQNLSGGQKTKLALARALLAEPEILLLDEPTNYLDIAGKKWVMNFLSRYPKTVIIISHDLKLLDQSIDRIFEVDPLKGKLTEYTGNYSQYLKLKKQSEVLFQRNLMIQQKKIKQMEESLRSLAGGTSTKGVRQRVIMQRRLARAQAALPEIPKEIKKIRFQLPTPKRGGEIPIKASHLKKSFANNLVLNDINFFITRGERLALVGHNGAGKSTLIKLLIGKLQPDAGEVILDPSLKLGYYSQEYEHFDLDKNLLQTIRDFAPLPDHELLQLLRRFLFEGEKIYQTVGSLSGGEKTRLAMALLLLQDNNLLILDEPTTYLDPISQRVILEALKGYSGAMIVVSHTEEFIAELKPNKVLLLPENYFDVWDDEYLTQVSKV